MMNFMSRLYRLLPSFRGKKRLGKLLFRHSLQRNYDRVITCNNNLRFHILNTYDSVGRDLFFDGVYEPETIRTIESLLKPGEVVVDAGANIGAISLPLATKNDVSVYAFEPGREIFKILDKNIKLNTLSNVKALNVALSDQLDELDFYESDRVHGWSGPVKIDSFNHYTVCTTTLDRFAEEHNIEKINILKADIQGWEYHLFKGAQNLISEGKIPYIVFEFEWWAEKNAGLKPGTAQQFLLDNGYELFTLKGKRITEPLRDETIMLLARYAKW